MKKVFVRCNHVSSPFIVLLSCDYNIASFSCLFSFEGISLAKSLGRLLMINLKNFPLSDNDFISPSFLNG